MARFGNLALFISIFLPLPSKLGICPPPRRGIEWATNPKFRLNYNYYVFYIETNVEIVQTPLTDIVYPDVCFVLRGYKAASIRNGRRRLSLCSFRRFEAAIIRNFSAAFRPINPKKENGPASRLSSFRPGRPVPHKLKNFSPSREISGKPIQKVSTFNQASH